ncbi:MAG: DUF1996 domain-containing protein [Actinomycetota bacterium]
MRRLASPQSPLRLTVIGLVLAVLLFTGLAVWPTQGEGPGLLSPTTPAGALEIDGDALDELEARLTSSVDDPDLVAFIEQWFAILRVLWQQLAGEPPTLVSTPPAGAPAPADEPPPAVEAPMPPTVKPAEDPAPATPTPAAPAAADGAPPTETPAVPATAEPTSAPSTKNPAPAVPTAADEAPATPATPVSPAPNGHAHHEQPPTSATASPQAPAAPTPLWRVTVGSNRQSTFDNSAAPGAGSAHGVRIYCTVSHFSHDDPIVFPNQPGRAHAHMFWGNTETNAYSTGASIADSGGSSCEGGTNNRSGYWTPAVFNAAGEAVVPETIFIYYKSFFRSDVGSDRTSIKPIPNGLEMLASRNVPGAGSYHFKVGGHDNRLSLDVSFPQCVAVDGDGEPILSSGDNVSHLAYSDARTASNCPASHPYRIPGLSFVLSYDIDPDSDWSLSSDDGAAKGSTLHADYVAGWDDTSMNLLVECNVLERRNCGFDGGRGQLPERFMTPDGDRIHRNSVQLEPDADRTPFGASIPAFASGQGHGHGHG